MDSQPREGEGRAAGGTREGFSLHVTGSRKSRFENPEETDHVSRKSLSRAPDHGNGGSEMRWDQPGHVAG